MLLLGGILVYFPVLATPFYSDDFKVLHRIINTGFFTVNFFRPLSDISIYLDYLCWGINASGFHATSILIHILTSHLVFLVTREVYTIMAVDKHVNVFAFLCAVLFLIYPFHNEAVVWIVGRGVLIATTFTLLSFLFYMKANGRKSFLFLAALFYLTALFGYESPLLLPVILLIFELLVTRRGRPASFGILIISLSGLLYLVIRYSSLGNLVGAEAYFGMHVSFGSYALNLLRLVERSIMPPVENFMHAIIGAACILAIFIIAYLKKRRPAITHRHLLTLCLMYLVALLPVISLGIDTHDTEGERFLYFPSFFFILLVVWLIQVVAERAIVGQITFTGIIGYCAYFLVASNYNWIKAGRIINNVITQAAELHAKGNLYIIDMPDNLNGAYIFRNGFAEAFLLSGKPLQTKKIIVLSHLHLKNGAESSLTNDTGRAYTGKRFYFGMDSLNSTVYINDREKKKRYEARAEDKIIYFSNGRFVPHKWF